MIQMKPAFLLTNQFGYFKYAIKICIKLNSVITKNSNQLRPGNPYRITRYQRWVN